jgi:hypothetical protein
MLNIRRAISILTVVAVAIGVCSCAKHEKDDDSLDRIKITGKQGAGAPVVLLRARILPAGTEPCLRTVVCDGDSVEIANFLKPNGCLSEIAVLTEGNALEMLPGIAWKNKSGEELLVPLKNRVSVPVKLWIITGDFAERSAVAKMDLNRAEQIYNGGGCGVVFALMGEVENLTDLEEFSKLECTDIADLVKLNHHEAGAVNVYYTESNGTGDQGKRCPGTHNIIIMATADGETLAHELGHAMALSKHTDTVSLPPVNIMRTDGGRSRASKGQCYRANLEPESALHDLGRGEASFSRGCDPVQESSKCPGLNIGGCE